MLVTDEGITNSRNDPQFPKATSPILVTDEGITNSRNDPQLPKAPFPILVMDEGIIILLLLSKHDITSFLKISTIMELSTLTSNFYSLAISIFFFGTNASWLYLVGFFFIPVAILIYCLWGPEKKYENRLTSSRQQLSQPGAHENSKIP